MPCLLQCGACGSYNTSQLQGPFTGGLPPGAADEMAQLQERLQATRVPAPGLGNDDGGDGTPSPEGMEPSAASHGVAANAAVDDAPAPRADSLDMLEAAADEVHQARSSVVRFRAKCSSKHAQLTLWMVLQRMSLQEQEASSAQAAVAEADAELALLRALRPAD